MVSVKQEWPARKVDHEPSKAAMATAKLRALAAVDEAVKGPDTLAEIFLSESQRIDLLDKDKGKKIISRHAFSMYEFLIARTVFFDAIFEQAVRHDFPQIVFLDAGYDSRPYRFKDLIKTSRIFELDAGPTQQYEINILKSKGVALPPGHVFLPIDFNTEGFLTTLIDAGFDTQKLTLFLWEGVSYYLSAGVVDETLRSIRSCLPGSSVVFDYAWDSQENLQEFLGARYECVKDRFGIKGRQQRIPGSEGI
jgi:methyltransferase (TIGR00027 family)